MGKAVDLVDEVGAGVAVGPVFDQVADQVDQGLKAEVALDEERLGLVGVDSDEPLGFQVASYLDDGCSVLRMRVSGHVSFSLHTPRFAP